MGQVAEVKKNPNTEFFRESIRENIELMRALAKNGKSEKQLRLFLQRSVSS